MEDNIINEILKVITNSPVFDASDYNDDWADEINTQVANWVRNNDVNDVEFTVSKEELEDVYGDFDSIKDITSKKINFVEDYCDLQDKMNEVLGDNYEGPGWNPFERADDRWNNKYFFTGSDCTHYVLVKKI